MLTKKQFKVWLAALRSGRHEQFFGDFSGKVIRGDTEITAYCPIGFLNTLTSSGMLDYGLPYWFFDFVVELNDYLLMPFSEIADWIEGIATAEGWM